MKSGLGAGTAALRHSCLKTEDAKPYLRDEGVASICSKAFNLRPILQRHMLSSPAES